MTAPLDLARLRELCDMANGKRPTESTWPLMDLGSAVRRILPSLLDELEAARRERDEAKAALAAAQRRIEAMEMVATYAQHSSACNRNSAYDVRCVCGLDAALAAAKEHP